MASNNGGSKNRQSWFDFVGNLTKDPEPSYTAKGTLVLHFSLAQNLYDDNDEQVVAEYYRCTVWDTRAEKINELGLTKGAFVKGRGLRGAAKFTGSDNVERTILTLKVIYFSAFDRQSGKWTDVLPLPQRNGNTSAEAEPITSESEVPF